MISTYFRLFDMSVFEPTAKDITDAMASVDAFMIAVGIPDHGDETLVACVEAIKRVQEDLRVAKALFQRHLVGGNACIVGPSGIMRPSATHKLVLRFANNMTYSGDFMIKSTNQASISCDVFLPFEETPSTLFYSMEGVSCVFPQLAHVFPMTTLRWSDPTAMAIVDAEIFPEHSPYSIKYAYPIINNILRMSGFIQVVSHYDTQLDTFGNLCARMVELQYNKDNRMCVVAKLSDGSTVGALMILSLSGSAGAQCVRMTKIFPTSMISRVRTVKKRKYGRLVGSIPNLETHGLKHLTILHDDSDAKIVEAYLYRNGVKEHLVAKPELETRQLTAAEFMHICKAGSGMCTTDHRFT